MSAEMAPAVVGDLYVVLMPGGFRPGPRRNTSGGSILLRTFAMFRSVEAQATADGVSVSVGTDYASFHQFGNPGTNLPQRAFLPLRAPGVADIPANWWQEILLPIETAIGRAAK